MKRVLLTIGLVVLSVSLTACTGIKCWVADMKNDLFSYRLRPGSPPRAPECQLGPGLSLEGQVYMLGLRQQQQWLNQSNQAFELQRLHNQEFYDNLNNLKR